LSQIPLKIIFAFKGDKVEYIESLIEEYQTQNSDVNIPNLIIVNNSFLIEKIGSETRRYPNGNPIAPGSSIAMSSSKYIGGIALMHMLTRIQTISNIGSQILMNFLEYTSKTDLTADAIDGIQVDIMEKHDNAT
jgi:hypothetical protein